jgi:dTDP-4-dehydrorhamnose reductase
MNDRPVILVTGANGQLGMEFRDLESSYPDYEFIFLSRAQLSIEDPQAIDRFFADHHIDYCINCAAYTAVDKAETDKEAAFSGNAGAPGYLALTAAKHHAAFFHFSTDYVFNGQATVPYKEDQLTDPINFYGASKREGELRVLDANPRAVVIRTSWVYSHHGKNFVKTMLRLMAEKPEISVVNDQVGSPTYARDLAAAVMYIITTHHPSDIFPGIFNYANRGVISWFEFALAIREISGLHCVVNPVPASGYPTPAKRPAYSVLETSKIREVYNVQIPEWKQSLESCLQRLNNGA